MSYDISLLSPTLGAVITGLDLGAELDGIPLGRIQADLDRHRVLFFREQSLTPTKQRDLAAAFGPLHRHPIYPHSEGLPEVLVLDTLQDDLRDNAVWHSDVSFLPAPAAMAVLHADIVPDVGGDTLWSCQHTAWQALSAPLQRWLGGLQAIHRLDQSFPPQRFGDTPERRARREKALAQHPPVSHPVVRRHPRTGEASLYVNEGFTAEIEGLAPAESRALLQLLFQHSQRPEFQIRWSWRPGDVAIWDNRNTLHYACDDYRPQHRRMRRATILGEPPLAMASQDRARSATPA